MYVYIYIYLMAVPLWSVEPVLYNSKHKLSCQYNEYIINVPIRYFQPLEVYMEIAHM